MSYLPFVERVIGSLVEHPEQVSVEEQVDGHTRTFFVTVAPTDVGKVIGKNGRVIISVRTVVSAVAAKSRERAYVKVVTE